jgi:glycosyltransferase involved in cell wall biosynthesis
MNVPEISVVIPTYNRLETLREVVPALLRQDMRADRFEIIIADSRSNDGTAEFLAGIAAKDARVRHIPGPYTGRAMARNAGIEAARGEIVMFTDSDILASPDLLSRHLAVHRKRDPVAVVGWEVQVDTFAQYEAYLAHPQTRPSLHPKSRTKLSWLYFMTGNASVPKAELDRVGRFDEDFTGYGHEDLELGYRLERAGIPIAYDASAVNYHWQYIPFAEQKDKMKLAGRSTVRFYRKHPAFVVKARLGMLPVSLALHTALERAPGVRAALERAGERSAGFARNTIYQYHYVSGIKEALADA